MGQGKIVFADRGIIKGCSQPKKRNFVQILVYKELLKRKRTFKCLGDANRLLDPKQNFELLQGAGYSGKSPIGCKKKYENGVMFPSKFGKK